MNASIKPLNYFNESIGVEEFEENYHALLIEDFLRVAEVARFAPLAVLVAFCLLGAMENDPFPLVRVVTLYVGIPCWTVMLSCLYVVWLHRKAEARR